MKENINIKNDRDLKNVSTDKSEDSKKDKLEKLINNIVIFSVIFLSFIIVIFFISEFSMARKVKFDEEIKSLNANNNEITLQIKDIINKSLMAKNYIFKWEKEYSPSQKNLSGIEVGNIQKTIEDIAIKDNIINLTLNFSPVIVAQDAFKRENLTVYTALITLTFNTITDINIYKFLDDLKNELPGFVVIQKLNFKRIKKIDENFLKTLSTMNIPSAVDGSVEIRIYNLKQNE